MAESNVLTIKNPQLKALCNRIAEFNNFFNTFLDQLNRISSPVALKETTAKIRELRKALESIKPTTPFEKLLIDHIMHSLFAQEHYACFFSEKTNITYEDLIGEINGEGWLDTIKDMVQNYDYESHWKCIKLNQRYYGRMVYSDDPTAQERIKALLPKLKKVVLKFGVERGFLPKDYDFELSLMPQYRQRSYWLPELKRMELDSNEFWCYKEDGEMKINCIGGLRTMFHEILGHGAHQENSKHLPEPIKITHSSTFQFVNLPHQEGLALFQQHQCKQILAENREVLGITDEDIVRSKYDEALTKSYSAYQLFFSYLKAKEKFDPDFDVRGELLRVTKNYGVARMAEENAFFHEIALIKEVSYLSGSLMISQIIDDISEQGYKTEAQPGDGKKLRIDLNRALIKGAWSWKVLKPFIEFCLREQAATSSAEEE